MIDGGHVQDRDVEKHSFEELIATVYRPEDILYQSNGRAFLSKKISVASAKRDKLNSIKKLTENACQKSGMNAMTEMTILSDGAKNCWSVVKIAEKSCKKVGE